MEMSESQVLPVSQQTAWEALNDPDVLKLCIPGCESIERTAENEYALAMVAAVGPVKARFQGKLQLSDLDPPRAYTLSFNGQGGAAGFGKGDAKVMLTAEGAASTRLAYEVHAQIGGKIAQIGSRLIDGAARKLAGGFFAAFDALLRERYPAEAGSGEGGPSEGKVGSETEGAAVSAGEGRTGDGTEDDASAAVLDAAATLGAPVPDPTLTPVSRDAVRGIGGAGEDAVEAAARVPRVSALPAGIGSATAGMPDTGRPSHPSTPRAMPGWGWALVVVVAAIVWYVTRAHYMG
ncbi:CoxG family protein [Pararobbsia alpina]|uniref:Carbon monoxide dehydrogenase subunit G n=1 Tax=Pararobbsia alpina TaxID=621374 RepID=A0A6S7AWY0_9BURK|nr:hypothetical protein LMG28138_01035 [Pararobbsia alpina]